MTSTLNDDLKGRESEKNTPKRMYAHFMAYA